jgi:hypothetical protein
MSTSAITANPLSQQLQQYFSTRQGDLQQLGQALGSGNLAGAQSAFNNIVSLGQNGPFAGGVPFKINQREQDFSAIGQALQSGDLAGAQQAFTALRDTFRPTPAASPASTSGPEIVVNLSSGSASPSAAITPAATPTSASTTPAASTSRPEIVLNLGNSGSSNPEQITVSVANSAQGEQVSLSVGNQGSNPQDFTFNLNPNSNEQIVLNLLGAASTTSTSSPSAGGALSVSA